MGIIAGIAVPVTIAVINRQKKNAAAKSAEAVVATMKQLTSELLGTTTGNISISLTYTADKNKPDTVVVKDGDTDITTTGGYTADDFIVENLKATGTLISTYNKANATYGFSYGETGGTFTVNGYTITANADGTCKAS